MTENFVCSLFCLLLSYLVSRCRKKVLEILCTAVRQSSNAIQCMFAFLDAPDKSLVPSVAYIPAKGYVARRPSPGKDQEGQDSPWQDDLQNIWPPGVNLLNPTVVCVMDLLVERAKELEKPARPSEAAAAQAKPDGPVANEVAWNCSSEGAKIVRSVLSRCFADLVKSLDGRPEAQPSSSFLEAGTDVDPKVTQQLEGDFIRLNLIAMASERYGPDILPRCDSVISFIGHGLAAAAFVLDPSKASMDALKQVSKQSGKGKVTAEFGSWTIDVFAAQVWALVSVQLCLALLSHLLEIDTKVRVGWESVTC